MGGLNSIDSRRAEAVEELRAAFAELESGQGLTRLVGGHGIQSRVFEFEWDEPALGIRFRLPYARVLSDDVAQKADDEEIGAAIRMAMLLLATTGHMESESRIEVSCDDNGTAYAVYSAAGVHDRQLPSGRVIPMTFFLKSPSRRP